jgi:hypothetical protein
MFSSVLRLSSRTGELRLAAHLSGRSAAGALLFEALHAFSNGIGDRRGKIRQNAAGRHRYG